MRYRARRCCTTGKVACGPERAEREHRAGGPETSHHVLLFLKSLDLVVGEIATGRARQLPSTSDFAVHFRELPAELARQLHEGDVCLGCFWHWSGLLDQPEGEAHIDPETFGFYQYDHTCENWISGPYGRIAVPRIPFTSISCRRNYATPSRPSTSMSTSPRHRTSSRSRITNARRGRHSGLTSTAKSIRCRVTRMTKRTRSEPC